MKLLNHCLFCSTKMAEPGLRQMSPKMESSLFYFSTDQQDWDQTVSDDRCGFPKMGIMGLLDFAERPPAPHRHAEYDPDASGHEVAAPVIQAAWIAQARNELEVTRLVGSFGIPIPKAVAEAPPHGVAVIEVWNWQQRVCRGRRAAEARPEFRLPFGSEKRPPAWTELIFDDQRQLQQFDG